MPYPERPDARPATPDARPLHDRGRAFEQRDLRNKDDEVPAEETSFDPEGDVEREGPIEGLQQGRTNTNRAFEDASDDVQGPDTAEANRRRVRGDPDFNPG